MLECRAKDLPLSDQSLSEPPDAEPAGSERAASGAKGFVAFRHHDFSLFLPSKFFAVTSHHMIMVAIGYQIYDLTGSTLALALVNLTMVAPVLGFALIIGYVADIFDRRTVLLWCYVILFVTAVLLCVITILGVRDLWPYYVLLTGLGTARAFFGPTSNALVPSTVPKDAFANAVAWNMTAAKCAQICGPVAGGLIYLLGPEVVYGVSAFTFIFGAFCSFCIRRREPPSPKGNTSPLKSLFVGLTYVFEKKIILGAVVVDVLSALMGGVQALLPVFAKDILDVGASGAGVLRSAIALGGLFAALTLTQLGANNRAGLTMLVGVAVFQACSANGRSLILRSASGDIAHSLARLEAGDVKVIACELTQPSPLSLEVLSARPYAFLDDAPLEERRTQAVMARRCNSRQLAPWR